MTCEFWNRNEKTYIVDWQKTNKQNKKNAGSSELRRRRRVFVTENDETAFLHNFS